MNISKNKLIRKGCIFSKRILRSVGGVFLITQMGCSSLQNQLGIVDKVNKYHLVHPDKKESTNEIAYKKNLNEDDIRPYLDNGTEVYADALKLVIFIGKLPNNGNPPIYLPGHKKAGSKILDYGDSPIRYNGFLFHNPTDNSDQFVRGDGTGVIIINQPTKKQIGAIIDKVTELDFRSDDLSIEKVEKLTQYFPQIGINDYYDSDRKYVDMTFQKIDNNIIDTNYPCGLYSRKDQKNNQVCIAILVEIGDNECRFHSKTTSAGQSFRDRAVIVKQGCNIRLVQYDQFIQTYKDKNGNPITATDLKKVALTWVDGNQIVKGTK